MSCFGTSLIQLLPGITHVSHVWSFQSNWFWQSHHFKHSYWHGLLLSAQSCFSSIWKMAICYPKGTQFTPMWQCTCGTQVTPKWHSIDTQVTPKWRPSGWVVVGWDQQKVGMAIRAPGKAKKKTPPTSEAQKVWTFRMATFNAQKLSGRSA